VAGIDGIEDYDVANMGATSLKDMIPAAKLSEVLYAYNEALSQTFYVPLAAAVVSIIGVVGMKWVKLPPE
jgi:ABC-type uncharacterized transport system permease subunit